MKRPDPRPEAPTGAEGAGRGGRRKGAMTMPDRDHCWRALVFLVTLVGCVLAVLLGGTWQ